jgi:DNA-binding beta-propeller fold protein YncE
MATKVKIHRVALLLAIPAALLISCATTKKEAAPAAVPTWPAAPDQPRVVFVRTISRAADIGQSPSVWRRMAHFVTGGEAAQDGLLKPFGVAVDESGNLCVADTGRSAVFYCDLARRQWRRYDAAGKTHFSSPVAVAHRAGVFYVADSELGKVFAFGADGRVAFTLAAPLQRPAGLALASDSLLVVDSQAHAVFVFDLQGRLRSRFGTRGTGAGEFNFPTHISSDSAGHLLVTDSLNSRIQVFNAQGKFMSQIGSAGDMPGHFGRPKGVAADSFGHVYVADAVFDNIQVFDLSGRLLLNLGTGGPGPGEFGLPAGIAIGPDNQIYIADSYNHRVQVLRYVGKD